MTSETIEVIVELEEAELKVDMFPLVKRVAAALAGQEQAVLDLVFPEQRHIELWDSYVKYCPEDTCCYGKVVPSVFFANRLEKQGFWGERQQDVTDRLRYDVTKCEPYKPNLDDCI